MEPAFRYWVSKDHRSAVVALFGADDKMDMVTIDVTKAIETYPHLTVAQAIYNLALSVFNTESSS